MMIAKFGGICSRCAQKFPAGTEIEYNKELRTATHVVCPDGGDRPAAAPTGRSQCEIVADLERRVAALEAARKVDGQIPF